MRKIFLGLLVVALATGGVRAQDAATQQQIDKLTGQLQDIIDAEAAQGKRMDAMEHDIADLRDKLNTPAANNYANSDDLQKLAAQMQEIDRKRLADRELILGKIEELAKISAMPPPTHIHHSAAPPADNEGDATTADATPQKGFEYKVEAGDNLTAIAKACAERGIKVTPNQILKANPKLKANTLLVGHTIFIPDPEASSKK